MMSDGLLTSNPPNRVDIDGFADDVALAIIGKTAEEVEVLTAE